MIIPGLGKVEKDPQFSWYRSKLMVIPVLGSAKRRFVVDGYDDDPGKDDFHVAIVNFLAIGPSVLKEAEPHILQYFHYCNDELDRDDEEFITLKSPDKIWRHIRLGKEAHVRRRPFGDKAIYILLECGCNWEEEHGLQIVFKNGERVNKIGPYDGHLTNSDAFDDPALEHVVFR